MDIFLTFCIVTPLVGGLVYILYVNGFMFFESKTALTFRGIQRKGCFGAKFRKCSGITKKVINITFITYASTIIFFLTLPITNIKVNICNMINDVKLCLEMKNTSQIMYKDFFIELYDKLSKC